MNAAPATPDPRATPGAISPAVLSLTEPLPTGNAVGHREGDRRSGSIFTPREREIAFLLRRGWRNKQVALSLGIAVKTVNIHQAHIYEKLGVRKRNDFANVIANTREL